MTRQEYYEQTETLCDIIEVASEYGHWAESIVNEDNYYSCVNSDLYDMVTDGGYDWEEVREYLDNIPTGYELYTCDGWLCYEPVNMTVEEIRDDLFDYLWENGYIDEEDEENEDSPIDIDYDEELEDVLYDDACDFSAGETISIDVLMVAAHAEFQEIQTKREKEQKKLNEAFQVLTLGE